jgi:hypothetical protein
VAPPDTLVRYRLRTPPDGEALANAVRASLRLDAAPLRLTVPLYGAMVRSVLGPADYTLHLAGRTGAGKTALAACALAHFGPELVDGRQPPASWTSTGNSLEALAHAAADAPLLVDDFVPSGSAVDVARAHRDADRLGRAQGN